jgi:tetratricopeptide (TPR) repeat protein
MSGARSCAPCGRPRATSPATYRAAIEDRQAAIDAYRRLGDRRREGDALRAMSANMRCFGLVAEAAGAGQAALEVLEPLDPGPELALAYANRAMLALNLEDAVATREWGTKALELAGRLDDRKSLVHAMNSVGTMNYLLGMDEGRLQLERSLELCRQWDVREQAGRAYIHLARPCAGATIRAAVYGRDGVDFCLEHGLDAWRFEISAIGPAAYSTRATGTRRPSDWRRSWSPNTNAVAHALALARSRCCGCAVAIPSPRPAAEAHAIADSAGEIQLLLRSRPPRLRSPGWKAT